ncbi:MAG: ABC transporter permease [Calditrichota bacterium]
MNMLWQQVKMELKLFIRERQTVFWTFFFPAFLIIIFGYVFNQPESIRFTIGFVDEDTSVESHRIYGELSRVNALFVEPLMRFEAEDLLRRNEIGSVVYIKEGYADSLKQGRAQIHLLYHPAQQQLNDLVRLMLDKIVLAENSAYLDTQLPITLTQQKIEADRGAVSFLDFLVPGLIGFSLMSTCLFSIGVVVVAYREKGKLRRLAVTPLPKWKFIAGQILARYVIVLAQATMLIGMAVFLFDVQMLGGIFTFFIALSIGMVAFIALGYAIASIAKTTESASGMANVLFIPMTLLSGVYFSADGLPGFLQPLVEALPLTHLVRAIRGIFTNGASLSSVLPQLLILTGWIITCFAFSVKKFKWE